MRGKLVLAFWQKDKLFLILALIIFGVAGFCTEYNLLTIMENYYKWNPVKELEGDWYFYIDRSENLDKVENYLKRKGAVSVLEFRRDHCKWGDPADIGYEDSYAEGVLWQASPEDLKKVQASYPEAGAFRSVAEVLKKEDLRSEGKWWITNLVLVLVLWTMAISVGRVWFRRALRFSVEEMEYLAYIGNHKKALRKLYCNSLYLLIPLLWLFSHSAVFFPRVDHIVSFEYSSFRQLCPPILIVMFVICYVMTRIFYFICRRIFVTNKIINDMYLERGVRRIYISDFSVEENLQLVLLTQGFSRELARTLTRLEMQERRIDFCAKRPMAMCPGEEKMVVYDLLEEFMQRVPVDI